MAEYINPQTLGFFREKGTRPVRFVLVTDEDGQPVVDERGKKQNRPAELTDQISSLREKWMGVYGACVDSGDPYGYRQPYGETHREYAEKITVDNLDNILNEICSVDITDAPNGRKDALKFIVAEIQLLQEAQCPA